MRGALVAILLLVVTGNVYVVQRGQRDFVYPEQLAPQIVMILGAAVHRDGTVSSILRDRLETAIDLYRRGLATQLLVTGDQRRDAHNEVGAMKNYLIAEGIPDAVIIVDGAGFDTYSSMYRARHVFGAEHITVVTQRFHLARALFLAQENGLIAKGIVADRHNYHMLGLREVGSRCKALFDVLRKRKPMFPGPSSKLGLL